MFKKTNKFVNESKPIQRGCLRRPEDLENHYGFDEVPPLLFLWSRLFQAVVSQAVTYLLTGKFHERECAIFKAEGGCNVPGVGELVLFSSLCRFDVFYGKSMKRQEKWAAELITAVVLQWDPMDPVNSMIDTAARMAATQSDLLAAAVQKTSGCGPFGGNALADFFKWNPFSEAPQHRNYEKWCLINFDGKKPAEVKQIFADRDLGKSLLERLRTAAQKHSNYSFVLCCSPKRFDDGTLKFWVNTGRSTQIDGWKTKKELEDYLASDLPLTDQK